MKRTESSRSFSEMKNKKRTEQQNKEKDEQSSRVNRQAVIKGSDTSLPGYMKHTVSSNMMERAQKISSKAEKSPKKKSSGSSLHPETNVTSQTCSSTLKNSKLLKQLELMEGGKESKGIKHVCRYTHCTLHGHHMHHSPRKDLSSAGRKIFRNQKSITLKRLSSSRKKGLDRGKRKIETGTKNYDIASTASTASCLAKAQNRELYTITHEEPSDTDESNQNTNATSWTYCSDTNSRIGFGESTADNYWNMSSEENMDTEGNLSVSDVDTMGRYIEHVKCQNQDKFEEDSSNHSLQDDNEWSSDPWLWGRKGKTMGELAHNETTRLGSHRPDMHLGEETSKFLSRGTINSVVPGFVPSQLRTLTSVEGSKRLGPGKIHQGGYLRNNAENTSDNKFKTKEVWVHNVYSNSECEPVDETPNAVHLQNSCLGVLDKKSDLHQRKQVGGFDDRKGSMISSNDLVCRMDSLSGNGVTTEATETSGTKPVFHKHALILNSNEAEEIELRDHQSTHAESERVQKKFLSYEKQQILQTAKKEKNYVTNKIKRNSKESAIQTSDQKEEKDVQEMDEKGNIRKPQNKLGKSEASVTICGLVSKEENPMETIVETAERDKSVEYEEDGYGGKAGIFSQYKSKGKDTFLGKVCSESQSALKENELSETTDLQTENLISGGKNATAGSANKPLNSGGKTLVAVQKHKPDQHVSDVSMDSCGMKLVEDVESQKYMPSSTDDIFCKTAYSKSLSNNYFEKTNVDALPEPESPLACAISSGNGRKYVHDAFGDKEIEMDVNPAAFQNNSEPKFENGVPEHSRLQESAFLDLPHYETVQKIEVEDDSKAKLKSKDSTQHTVVTTFDDPRDTYSLENPWWLVNEAEEFEEYTVREANKENSTERPRTSVEENKFSSFSSNGSKITKVHAQDQNLESSNVNCKEIYLQEERSISSINKMPSSFAVSNYESDKTISHKQVEISDSTVKDLPHNAEKIVNAQTAGIENSFEASGSNNVKMFTNTGESRDRLKNCLADTTEVENKHNAFDATHNLLENQMQDHILYANNMTEQGKRERELNIKHSSNDEAKKNSHLQHVNAAMERSEEKNSSDNKPEALKEKIAGDKILSNQDHAEEIKRGCENNVISDIRKLKVQNPNPSSSGNSAETSEESKIKTKTDTTYYDDETTDSCFLNDALIISKGQSDTYLQNNGEENYQPKPSKGCSPTSPHPIPPINQKSESLGPDHNNTTCSTEKHLGSSAFFGNREYAEILQENSKGRELQSGVSGPAISEIDVEKAEDDGFDIIPCYAGNTSNITTLQAPNTTRSSPNIESNVQGELEDAKNIEFKDKEDETSDTTTRDENRKDPLIVTEVKSISNAKVERNLFQMEPPNQASHLTAEKIDSGNGTSETAKFEISTSDHGGKKAKSRGHNLVPSEESHELEAALSKGFQQANYEEMEDKEHELVKPIDKNKNIEGSLVDAMETTNDVQVETNLSKIKTSSHAPLKTVEKHIKKEEAETKTEISRFNHVKKELSLPFNDKRNDDEEHSCSLNNTNNSDENQPETKADSAATSAGGNTSDTMTTCTSSIHPISPISELQEEEFLKNHENLVGSPSQANKIVTKVEDITCLDESQAKPEAHGLLTNNRGEISDTTITRQEQEKASQSELICKTKDEDSLQGFFQVTCAQSSAEKKITGIIDAEKENGIHSNNSKEYARPATQGETSKKIIASPTHSSGHISEEHGSCAREKGTPEQINEIIGSLEDTQKFNENNTDECMEPKLAANQGETYGTRSKQQELTSNSGLISEPYEEEPLRRHPREMGSPRSKGKSLNTKEINESDLEFNGLKSLKTHGTQEKRKNNIGSAYRKFCPSNATKSNDHQSNGIKECALVTNQGEAANTVTTSISQANVPQPKSRSCEEESDRECVDDIHSPYSSDEIKIKLEEYQPDDSETIYQGERVDAEILQVPRSNSSGLISESDECEFSEMDDQSVDTPNSRNKIFSSFVIFDLENDFLFEEPGETDGFKIEDAFTHDTNKMHETADEEPENPIYDSFSPEACPDMVANNDNLYNLQGSNVKGRNTNNQEDVSNSARIKISDHSPKITVTDIAEEENSLGKVKIGRVNSTCKETSPDAFYSEVDSDAYSVQEIKKSEASQLTHSPEQSYKTNVTKGQIRKHNNRNFRSESCKGLSDKYSHGDDDTAHDLRNFRSASSKGLSNKYSHRDDDTAHHLKNEINKINQLCRSLSDILDTNKGPQSRESLTGCKRGRSDASCSKNSVCRLSSLRFESSEPKGSLGGVLNKNAGPHIQESPRGCIQASNNAANSNNSFQQMSPLQFESNTIVVSKESSVTGTASPLLDRADLEERKKRNAEGGTRSVRSNFVESEAIDSLITSNKHLNHNGPAEDNGQSQNNVNDMNSTGKVESTISEVVHNMAEDDEMDTELQTDTSPIKSSSLQDDIQSTSSNYQSDTCYEDDMDNELAEDAIKSFSNREAEKCTHRNENSGSFIDISQMANDAGPIEGEKYCTTAFEHCGKIVYITSVETDSDQLHPETIKKLKATSSMKKSRLSKNSGKQKASDRKIPELLPAEPDPEAEWIDLRHQEIETKDSERWLIDYALRQIISKLIPVRKKKVALLVEAFEAVKTYMNGTI